MALRGHRMPNSNAHLLSPQGFWYNTFYVSVIRILHKPEMSNGCPIFWVDVITGGTLENWTHVVPLGKRSIDVTSKLKKVNAPRLNSRSASLKRMVVIQPAMKPYLGMSHQRGTTRFFQSWCYQFENLGRTAKKWLCVEYLSQHSTFCVLFETLFLT